MSVNLDTPQATIARQQKRIIELEMALLVRGNAFLNDLQQALTTINKVASDQRPEAAQASENARALLREIKREWQRSMALADGMTLPDSPRGGLS